jgi:hypothetical protein
MANGRKTLEKLAPEARHKDTQAANDAGRAATQSAILINGGAATAVLAYLAKESIPSPILRAVLLSLVIYAFGVAFAAGSMWCSAHASGAFGLTWQHVLDKNAKGEKQSWENANKWLGRHRAFFAVSIALFLVASCVVAYGFLGLTQMPGKAPK